MTSAGVVPADGMPRGRGAGEGGGGKIWGVFRAIFHSCPLIFSHDHFFSLFHFKQRVEIWRSEDTETDGGRAGRGGDAVSSRPFRL